jgi:hypothetical protein
MLYLDNQAQNLDYIQLIDRDPEDNESVDDSPVSEEDEDDEEEEKKPNELPDSRKSKR